MKTEVMSSTDEDIYNQENVSARSQVARQAKQQQVRHRASVACASCRDRRIRCVVPKGEQECTQCKRTGTMCVIKNDDERRRPISKAYMLSLSDRINLLENMLLNQGVVPPPAVHPPKTRQDGAAGQQEKPQDKTENKLEKKKEERDCKMEDVNEMSSNSDQKQHPHLGLQRLQDIQDLQQQQQQQDQAQQGSSPPQNILTNMVVEEFLSMANRGYCEADKTIGHGAILSPPPSVDIQGLYGLPQSKQSSDQQLPSYASHSDSPPVPSSSRAATTTPASVLCSPSPLLPPSSAIFKATSNSQTEVSGMIGHLLSTQESLLFDHLSGQLRYFGPTANIHVHALPPDRDADMQRGSGGLGGGEWPEQVRRSMRIIRSLTQTTHNYLMECFWTHYNAILCVVDRAAFEEDHEAASCGIAEMKPDVHAQQHAAEDVAVSEPTVANLTPSVSGAEASAETTTAVHRTRFYTTFLHMTILAMGFRFADRSRDDIRKISLGNRESTLHLEAKYMLDMELERPGGIASVQALLLLGDLESGVGRDNTGWMYAGMANRLAIDLGLSLDCRAATASYDMTEREANVRRVVMKAVLIFDKYWALFLGRPTSIKSQDVTAGLYAHRISSSTNSNRPFDDEVYDHLFELMELAGKIVEPRSTNGKATTTPSLTDEEYFYMHVMGLDRQLQSWYRRLPEHLAWKPENVQKAPMSFFLLHQQYHTSLILLHQPCAHYDTIMDGPVSRSSRASRASRGSSSSSSSSSNVGSPSSLSEIQPPVEVRRHSRHHNSRLSEESRVMLSRSICVQHAVRVTRIFWLHRQRFDSRRISGAGVQHAGVAALTLLAAITGGQDPAHGARGAPLYLSSYSTSSNEHRCYLACLGILSAALTDMSHTYQPAALMEDMLRAAMQQLRSDGCGSGSGSTSPGKEGSYHYSNSAFSASSSSSASCSSSSSSSSSSSFVSSDIYSILPDEIPASHQPHDDSLDASQRRSKRQKRMSLPPSSSTSSQVSDFSHPLQALPPPPPLFVPPTPPSPVGSIACSMHMDGNDASSSRNMDVGTTALTGFLASSSTPASAFHINTFSDNVNEHDTNRQDGFKHHGSNQDVSFDMHFEWASGTTLALGTDNANANASVVVVAPIVEGREVDQDRLGQGHGVEEQRNGDDDISDKHKMSDCPCTNDESIGDENSNSGSGRGHTSLDWVTTDISLNTLNQANVDSLVDTAGTEKMMTEKLTLEGEETGRNQELDFFRF